MNEPFFMLKNFRTYQIAVCFYRTCENVRGAAHLCDQLRRASSGIVLNLAEGSERPTDKDKRRFYTTAMGSIRECQAILDLLPQTENIIKIKSDADIVAASIFRLVKTLEEKMKSVEEENQS